jgi:hypothetical protein
MSTDPLHEHVTRMVDFLRQHGVKNWADILDDIIGKQGRSKDEVRRDLRKLFGTMGSLTDLNLIIKDDPDQTREINDEFSRQTERLFELVDRTMCYSPKTGHVAKI